MGIKYAAVPQAEGSGAGYALDAGDDATNTTTEKTRRMSNYEYAKRALIVFNLLMFGLIMGFCVGRKHPAMNAMSGGTDEASTTNGLLPPSAFVPDSEYAPDLWDIGFFEGKSVLTIGGEIVPMKQIKFDFPTPYEDTSIAGDKLWDALMPIGSGFVRVPYPRKYDMPASKAIEDDPDEAEIYSLSVLHQLHCLGVIRDVIKKYEKHDKSRFAGRGHEYHCIDYIRQSIMCAGDMTLDYAEVQEDGTRRGFSGANSTHQCRDWDAIVSWAEENREGDKKGIA
ncbi:hypothetical protein N0V82_003960 [Gnomoniopsis sp. IMI 355080]|nr:hypothetical protein N0V82_003960 [Gnomoniopsis sp. IMI 355080]